MRFQIVAALAAALQLTSAQEPDSDLCLQRKFLSSLLCEDIDPSYNNDTLPALGWFCCWHQGPFLPPPAEATSAWLVFGDDGEVANRCLTGGTCVEYYNLPDDVA
ncbi:hypothetical protein F5Y15DRAFT_420768 [Xylariaceae sp. FL0016]|nr:hypothetical protein F5Y15DRAFT_420768 [Xylariaceae sp. FL0016]